MNRTYTYPPEVEILELRRRASLRRLALVAAGCSTYTIGYRDAQPAIMCLCCGLGSSNAHDIANRFCGLCGEYHAEWLADEPVMP